MCPIGYAYNAAGAVTDLTYPTGEVLHHDYTKGYLTDLTGNDAYASNLQYNVFGALASAAYGNGDTAGYEYFQNGRPSRAQANA
ncbi:MAG: hypothetical protein Q8R92_18225, partial [Deltaproteobacteria bacterium]|nr:hypothetical protein [Deltaproteobacteria bacterium]